MLFNWYICKFMLFNWNICKFMLSNLGLRYKSEIYLMPCTVNLCYNKYL